MICKDEEILLVNPKRMGSRASDVTKGNWCAFSYDLNHAPCLQPVSTTKQNIFRSQFYHSSRY